MDCCKKEKDCCPCESIAPRIECLQAQITQLTKQVDELNKFSFAVRYPDTARNEDPNTVNSLIAMELDNK